jgi:hypothetical protein
MEIPKISIPLKEFEKLGHEALEPTDDEIYFSILRVLNERQKGWLFKYIDLIRKVNKPKAPQGEGDKKEGR